MGSSSRSYYLLSLLLLNTLLIGTSGFPTLAANDTCVSEGFSCSSDCETVYQCLGSGPFNQIVREVCDSEKGYFCSANIGKCVSTFASTCAPPGYSFSCTSVGTFPDPYDCAGYHICYGDNNNLQHSPEECESGWLYDPYSTVCEIQASYCTDDPVPACKNVSQIGALNKNPSIYYVCTQNNPDGPLYPILYECPHGQIFDSSILSCTNNAVSTGTPDVTTVPATPTEYTSETPLVTTVPPTPTEYTSGTPNEYTTASLIPSENTSGTQEEYTTASQAPSDDTSGTRTEYTTVSPIPSETQTETISLIPSESTAATSAEDITTQSITTTSEVSESTTTPPTTTPPTTAPPTTTAVPSTTSSSGFSCVTVGNFIDPLDCFSYYECSEDLVATHHTCGFGQYFSDIFGECVWGIICIE